MVQQPNRGARLEPADSLGQTWWLSEVTANIRKQFCRPIRARARQALIDDRESMDADAYAAEQEALQDRIDTGAYDWGPPLEGGGTGPGRAVKAVLDTLEGQVQLTQLLLAEKHGELPIEQVVKIITGNQEGVAAAIRAAMGLPPLPPEEGTGDNPGAEKEGAKESAAVPTPGGPG